jgi:NTE family protein/lysophospholipid hydrolase
MVDAEPGGSPLAPAAEVSLAEALRTAEVFQDLHDSVRCNLAADMSQVLLQGGETVMRQGESTDTLFVVMAGELAITCVDRLGRTRVLNSVGPGHLLGGPGLLVRTPASVTACTVGPVRLAALSREGFDRFAERCPSGMVDLLEALGPTLRRHRLWVALNTSDAFRQLDVSALEELETRLELVPLYSGEVVMREGEPGSDMFVVVSGRLRVVTTGANGAEVILAELGPGETVGEMAVISGEPRSATVYAIRDSQLARLSTAQFEHLLERHPKSTFQIVTGRLVARLGDRANQRRRPAAISTVAVVGAAPGAPASAFASRLTASLAQLGEVAHLTSAVVDRDLGRPGVAHAFDREGWSTQLVEWLAEQEVDHRFVVYEGDAGLTPWTERTIRQADHVVVVADASADPEPGEIEAELLGSARLNRARHTLALVYEDGSVAPSQSARWRTGRRMDHYMHARLDRSDDFDRLARLLTGNAVGLALGGGFARGLAHVGVFRALEELRIPIDLIGGSSIGAIVGAQWALGWSAADIARRTSEGLATSFDDTTLPFLSTKRGGKHSRVIRQSFGETRIEDLWLPYFCVSTNLNRSELKIHSTGPLAQAVTASSRAPGVFPPLVIDGELHVDGGVINNVPVDVMRDFTGVGIVIGVDVSPSKELNEVANYGDEVSGWKAAWSRFNPNRKKHGYRPPSMLFVFRRLIEFSGISYRKQKAEMADVCISPDVARFKRDDFHSAADLADAGYRAAREALTKWLGEGGGEFGLRRPDLFGRRCHGDESESISEAATVGGSPSPRATRNSSGN